MGGGPRAGVPAPVLPWFRRGSAAWVLLAAGILAWDVTAPDEQMLSEVFRRCKDDPAAWVAVVVAWSVLTAHLFGVLPPRADPLHAVTCVRDVRRYRGLRYVEGGGAAP